MTPSDGSDLFYQVTGSGPRLLFLNGSGVTLEEAALLVGMFSSSRRVLSFDYRGLGKSGPLTGGYTMADCAADARRVLDAVGWGTAPVVGISFGGMVALELAVSAPERLERLVLLCTSAGGGGGSSYPLHELESLDVDERTAARRQLMDTRFDEAWLDSHPGDRRLVEMLEAREPGRGPGFPEQLEARKGHDTWDRLDVIACPTFIGCGRFDGIAPPRNSEAMASRIREAELHVYEGGHAFLAQDPQSLPDVLAFLQDVPTS
ncbi:MAG TPA: alpha/beta hydrolase [Acidimicrobiales bacterium]|nr:alpha/beta hydrolase [Acidimicrobiales bacterium]